MNEWLAPLLATLGAALVMLVAGTSFFVVTAGRAGTGTEVARYIRNRGNKIVSIALAVFVVTQLAQAWYQGHGLAQLSGAVGNVPGAWRVYVETTVPGKVWLFRTLFAVLIFVVVVAYSGTRNRGGRGVAGGWIFAFACSSVLVASSALSGHYAGGVDSTLDVPIHAAHLLATAYWFGSLPLWIFVVMAFGEDDKCREQAFFVVRKFSRHALLLVLMAVVSGFVLADRFITNQGDLFGTAWGWLLAGKLLLIAGSLYSANILRHGLSSGNASGIFSVKPSPVWYAVAEFLLLLVAISLAASMSTVTPATHEQPHWIFPFRMSFTAISTDQNLVKVFWAGIVIASAGCVAAITHIKASGRGFNAAAWLVTAGVGTGMFVWAAAVPAYENTYRRSEVPYLAESIASGIHHYSENCVQCHGFGARGDGPLSTYALLPPADLSAPHTALHTAGDLFQWIGNGMPSGAMPGFSHVLDDEARWDLVNFLRAFSQGFQARIIGDRITFNKPWLAAPDFYLTGAGGGGSQLKALRGEPVLLVIADSCNSARNAATAFTVEKVSVTYSVVLACRQLSSPGSAAEAIWYAQSPDAVIETYALLGRTIEDRGQKDSLGTYHQIAAFLIDKYGYVRSKYLGSSVPQGAGNAFRLSMDELGRESVVPDPPDAHVH